MMSHDTSQVKQAAMPPTRWARWLRALIRTLDAWLMLGLLVYGRPVQPHWALDLGILFVGMATAVYSYSTYVRIEEEDFWETHREEEDIPVYPFPASRINGQRHG